MICRSDEVLEGGDGIRFTVQVCGEAVAAFLVRYGGRVYAYRNSCAHVPVELDWLPGKFFDDSRLYVICATHGATYEPETGYCVSGPCRGARLEPLRVVERDGGVYLDE